METNPWKKTHQKFSLKKKIQTPQKNRHTLKYIKVNENILLGGFVNSLKTILEDEHEKKRSALIKLIIYFLSKFKS